jgi:formylglycine-generating enzyme required for sulfatase activity
VPEDWRCDARTTSTCFVRVPGGSFPMGAQAASADAPNHDPDAEPHEGPVHVVTVSSFWIHRHEATVGQLERCLGSGWCREADVGREPGSTLEAEGSRDRPATHVTWAGAERFCAWLGGRLPTEAEWEYAARGADGRRWPWGDEPGCGTGYEDPSAAWSKLMETPPCRHDAPSPPPDLRGPSPFGVQGLAGNVWEWVADTWAADAYASHAATDPTGPAPGNVKVLRGGGWMDEDARELRSAGRTPMPADAKLPDVGFRCVLSER